MRNREGDSDPGGVSVGSLWGLPGTTRMQYEPKVASWWGALHSTAWSTQSPYHTAGAQTALPATCSAESKHTGHLAQLCPVLSGHPHFDASRHSCRPVQVSPDPQS